VNTHVNGAPIAETPSWDDNAEKALLGAIMLSPVARDTAATVTASDFYRPAHQTIYRTIQRLATHGQPVDHVTVLDAIIRARELRPGLLDGPYLHTCQRACAAPGNAEQYVDIIRRHAQHRAITERITRLTQLATLDLTDPEVITTLAAETGHLGDVITGITTTSHRKPHLMPASAIPLHRVRWLWDTTPHGAPPTSHGRIPLNSLAIGAGTPGVGKSQFAVWLTARITRGELPGELAGEPAGVIYAAAEDSWSYTIAPRLIAAGANLDYVYRVDITDDRDPHARLTLPTDTDDIGRICEAQGIGLFVADPLLSLIDGHVNDYRATEVRAALEPLLAAAERYQFTIFGLAHFTKNGAADPLTRLAGSGAFGQLIRSMIAFSKDDDGGYVMSLEKSNLGREDLPGHAYTIRPVTVDTPDGPTYVSRFELGEETTTTVQQVMRDASATTHADRAEQTETVQWLREHLENAGGTDTLKAIRNAARHNGMSQATLYRAKTKLGVETTTTGFGGGRTTVWTLPEDP
jgi:hypothetical protein